MIKLWDNESMYLHPKVKMASLSFDNHSHLIGHNQKVKNNDNKYLGPV